MGVTNTSLHFLPHFLPSAYSNPLHQNTAGASGKLQPTSAPRLKTEIIRELTGIDLFVVRVSIRMNVRIVGGCFFRQANLQRLHFFCKRTQLLVILAAPGNLSNVHPEWKEQCRIFHPSPLLFSSPCTNYSVSRCQQRYIHHPPTWSRF